MNTKFSGGGGTFGGGGASGSWGEPAAPSVPAPAAAAGPKCQSRLGDMSMGHWVGPFYFKPVALITASPDTFSCNIAACRVTDKAEMHIGYLGGVVPVPAVRHNPVASTGANETLINWLPAFRIGDSYDCGDTQAQGCCEDIPCK